MSCHATECPGGSGLGSAAHPLVSKASVSVFQKLQAAPLPSLTMAVAGMLKRIGLERPEMKISLPL